MTRNLAVSVFVLLLSLAFSVTASSQPLPCGEANSRFITQPLRDEYGGLGPHPVTRVSIQHPDPAVPAAVSVYLPSNASVSNRLPVIFFAHGFGGFAFSYYDALLRRIASNGYIVVFAPYSVNIFANHQTLYQQLWSGFQLAVAQYGSVMDTTRVGFAGHSYGAGAVPELTRRGVNAGWGSNGLFMFVMAAWYSWGSNYEQIPPSAKLIVQVYWDDQTNQHLISQNDIWNKLPQIIERRWEVIRSDRRQCFLYAGHGVPVSGDPGDDGDGGINAHDHWGVWRRIHALADYTFAGNASAKAIAFGDDPQMGLWRTNGRRAVTPLEASTSPVVNSTSSPRFTWGAKCLYAFGSPCP
jgi:hypothetical protein